MKNVAVKADKSNVKTAGNTESDDRPLVLIVEDSRPVGDLLERVVRECESRCARARDARGAASVLESQMIDLVVLDLHLPDRSGTDLLKDLRAAGNDVPVFVVTGIQLEATRLELLRAGADDFLTKPFNVDEFELRLRSLLRRARPSRLLTVFEERLSLDPGSHGASWNSQSLGVTPTEFGVLWMLAEISGRYAAIEEISRRVLGSCSPKSVIDCRTHLHRLRVKLSIITRDILIQSRRRVGYRLIARRLENNRTAGWRTLRKGAE